MSTPNGAPTEGEKINDELGHGAASVERGEVLSPAVQPYADLVGKQGDLCRSLGSLPNPKDPGYKEAMEAARQINNDKSRISHNLKHFESIPDKRKRDIERKRLLDAAKSEDIFELQTQVFDKDKQNNAYADMTLMFLREKNLVPTCGQLSFTADFGDNKNFEMSIGLAHILPPTVTKVEVSDTKNPPNKRVGERKTIDGRVGYYDEAGYIPIFNGFNVKIVETVSEDDSRYKEAVLQEQKNFERLKQEYNMIKKEETESAGPVRMNSFLADPNAPQMCKDDFYAIQDLFSKSGIQWDTSVWLNGGAALQQLNGKGAEMLKREDTMNVFNVLAKGGDFLGIKVFGNYRAHIEDIKDVADFAVSVKASKANQDRFLALCGSEKNLTGYALLNIIRRYVDGVAVVRENILVEQEASKYLQDTLDRSDKTGRRIFENSSRTFVETVDKSVIERRTIDRLNKFGWAPDSFAMVVTASNQNFFLVHKNASGEIDFVGKFRVSMGRRDKMGSNVSGSNGTPSGMMEWMASGNQFKEIDNMPIGQNKKPEHKERGRAGITTRWIRTRGLESSNDNNVSRGILFHGGGYMDSFRGGYAQTWVPRSRGCVVMSNADTLIAWSYMRQNFLKGQKVLCDVVV